MLYFSMNAGFTLVMQYFNSRFFYFLLSDLNTSSTIVLFMTCYIIQISHSQRHWYIEADWPSAALAHLEHKAELLYYWQGCKVIWKLKILQWMCKLKVKNLYGIYKLKVAVLEEVSRAYTFIQYIILIDYINGFFLLIHTV